MIRALALRELLFWARPTRLLGGILVPAAVAALLAVLDGPTGGPAAAAILALAAVAGTLASMDQDRGNEFHLLFLGRGYRALPTLAKVVFALGAPLLFAAWVAFASPDQVAAPGIGGPLGCAALAASLSCRRMPAVAPVFGLIALALWGALGTGSGFALPHLLTVPIMPVRGAWPFHLVWPAVNLLILAAVLARDRFPKQPDRAGRGLHP